MKVKIPGKVTESLAYETGLHIGDGSMNYYAHGGIYSLRGDKKKDRRFYQEIIKPLYEEVYDADVHLRDWKDVFGFQICSDELVEFKHCIGLPLGPKINVAIPEVFLTEKNLRLNCLRGLIETDGTIYLEPKNNSLYPRIEFGTTSEPLAKQVSALLTASGFKFHERKQVRSNGWLPIYRFYIRGKPNLEKWLGSVGINHPYLLEKIELLDS